MSRVLFVCSLLLLAMSTGCSTNNENRPSDLIDEDVFVQILADIHVSETEIVVGNLSGAELSKRTPSYYKASFDKHQVSETEFERTFNYYSFNTEAFEVVYEKVVVELSKRQADLAQ